MAGNCVMQQQLDQIIINLTSQYIEYDYKLILIPPQWLASHCVRSNQLGSQVFNVQAPVTTCDQPVTL